MWFNVIAGLLIFGYAGWTVFNYMRKAKKGKCAACELSSGCQVSCDSPSQTLGNT